MRSDAFPSVSFWHACALRSSSPLDVLTPIPAMRVLHVPSAAGALRDMKTIGILGGMSWESTIPYYRLINEAVKQRLGGLHSARVLLHSVDFAEIESFQRSGDWHAAGAGTCT